MGDSNFIFLVFWIVSTSLTNALMLIQTKHFQIVSTSYSVCNQKGVHIMERTELKKKINKRSSMLGFSGEEKQKEIIPGSM